MLKIIALICCFAISGCSVWMTNPVSPIKLSGCDNIWPPAADFVSGVAMVATTAAVVDHNVGPAAHEQAYITGGLFLAGIFMLSAMMGSGEKYMCPK